MALVNYDFSKTAFKLTYANHKKTFNNIQYQTDAELSNGYWNIISANETSNTSWEILGIRKSYNHSSKRCLPCLHKDDNILNKRSEVKSKCRQRNKYLLVSYDS